MTAPITTYNGIWWTPEGALFYPEGEVQGTLTYYGNESTELSLFHKPSHGVISRMNCKIPVIWGKDAEGNVFSAFDAVMIQDHNFTKTTFAVAFVLVGAHVSSLSELTFDSCVAKYQYLINWAQKQRMSISLDESGNTIVTYDVQSKDPIVEVEVESGLRYILWGEMNTHATRTSFTATQGTNLIVRKDGKLSIQNGLQSILEFSQFISIALYRQQNPAEVFFKKDGDQRKYYLLFKTDNSYDNRFPLIKYDKLKNRIPDILTTWHKNYHQMSPVSSYFVQSLSNEGLFDAPDFLIIAQALDGYYKRFINNENEKTRQYKQQIDKLLKHFKGVEALEKCNIDAEVVTQSRHKYSHLIPDDDEKVQKAAVGEDLLWLTQKCKILLTCCILDNMGLTIDEINLCCNDAPISFMLNAIPSI